jgi:hypothetical protein
LLAAGGLEQFRVDGEAHCQRLPVGFRRCLGHYGLERPRQPFFEVSIGDADN